MGSIRYYKTLKFYKIVLLGSDVSMNNFFIVQISHSRCELNEPVDDLLSWYLLFIFLVFCDLLEQISILQGENSFLRENLDERFMKDIVNYLAVLGDDADGCFFEKRYLENTVLLTDHF